MCTKRNKNDIKGSTWSCEYKEFVADVGNESVTATLEFTSAKDFVFTEKAEMPPYPAMYMNADGTVPTMPGYSREYSFKGTYEVGKESVILTSEKGGTITLLRDGDNLTGSLTYRTITLTRAK